MNKTTIFVVLLMVLVVAAGFIFQEQFENKQKTELVSLVDQAVQLL